MACPRFAVTRRLPPVELDFQGQVKYSQKMYI